MDLGRMVTMTLFPDPAALKSSPSPVSVKADSPEPGTLTVPVPIWTVWPPTALGVSNITFTSEMGTSGERSGTSTEKGTARTGGANTSAATSARHDGRSLYRVIVFLRKDPAAQASVDHHRPVAKK